MEEVEKAQVSTLPSHLKREIASYLDRNSAVSLSATCTALRDAGENSTWSELNISLDRAFHMHPHPYEYTRPLGGNKLYVIRRAYQWNDHDGDDAIELVDSAVNTYLEDLCAFLQAHPARRSAVRSIYFDLDRSLPSSFVKLLNLVHPTLTSFHIIPGTRTAHPHTPSDSLLLTNSYASLDISMPHLRHLQLVIGSDWDKTLDIVLPVVPRLRSLKLTCQEPFYGGYRPHTIYRPANVEVWPSLILLEHLEVDQMDPHLAPFLIGLVQSSPRLRRVILHDPLGSWNPRSSRLIELLSTLKLEYIHASSEASFDTFSSIRRLSLTQRQPRKPTLDEQVNIQ